MKNSIVLKDHLIIFLFICGAFYKTVAKKTMKIDEYAPCGKDPSCPIKIHNMSLDYSGEDGFSINAKAELYRDLDSRNLRIDIAITRCLSKEAPDTCEKLSNLQSPGLCRLLGLHGVGWDGIVDGFQPNLRCPHKKGVYVGKGLNLNPSAFKLFPLEGYYWKVNGSLFEGKQYLASLCFALTVYVIK